MKCISPIYVKSNVVPCGKCNYCRQLRMLDWAFRLKNEMRYAHSAFFVTLTLRFAPQSGVSKRHLQLYLKRLRKRRSLGKIVYFAVAEYGERTLRPHYHAIIFNATESSVADAWKLGRVHIGAVSDASIAYVANYSIKGSRYPRGQCKPFSLMSRRPAIGSKYLETHTSWHRNGQDVASHIDAVTNGEIVGDKYNVDGFKPYTMVGGVRGHLPRFYRDKMFTYQERKVLTQQSLKDMDESIGKEIIRLRELGYSETHAFNYMLERHVWHHDNLINQIVKNESI